MSAFVSHSFVCSLIWFRYLYFFEKGNPQITTSVIQGLIELIKTEMQSDSATANTVSDAFFTSTLRYIQFQKQKGGAMGEKYDPIKLWHVDAFFKCHDFPHKSWSWIWDSGGRSYEWFSLLSGLSPMGILNRIFITLIPSDEEKFFRILHLALIPHTRRWTAWKCVHILCIILESIALSHL